MPKKKALIDNPRLSDLVPEYEISPEIERVRNHDYLRHQERMGQLSYEELLNELWQATHLSPSQPLDVGEDFKRAFRPHARYARMFLIQTLMYIWGRPYEPDDPDAPRTVDADGWPWKLPSDQEKKLGERARRALERLLFDPHKRGAGRPLERKRHLAAAGAIRAERPRLLERAQQMWVDADRDTTILSRPLADLARDCLGIAESEAKGIASRLLRRRGLRPAHIVNYLMSQKYHGWSESAIQREASTRSRGRKT